MKFRKLFEALEDERDLLFAASDYKCKLTSYDMEEAADWNMLLEYIKEVYHILMEEFGDNIKMWKFYEDNDSDIINGYKVWLNDGTKHIIEINNDRVDIVEGLELKEEDEPIKFIIVAVDNDGNRLFYNAESNTFVDSHTDATIYDEHNDAIAAWHKIDKKKYKRVFVPNYNPSMFEAVNKPLNEGELEEGRNNPYFTPYGYRDAIKVLNRTAPEYYWHLKEIEMDKGDGVKLARYALKKGMPIKVDINSDPDYPEFYLKDGISEYHWNDYFYPYGTTTDMSDLLLWDGKMFVTEDYEDPDPEDEYDYRYAKYLDPDGPGIYSDESETDYRYYVYDATDNVVSDGFEYDEDAVEFAQENNYPVVKIHNYFRDADGKLEPDGGPEVIWSAE